MSKRLAILMIVLILSFLTVSSTFAVPLDENGAVMDIDHRLPLVFWQSGYLFFPDNPGWECKKIADPDKGIASSCRQSSGYFASDTIGGKGCALTSLTMLYWYHGTDRMPDTLQYLDPGQLNDWMVDNQTYTPDKGVNWWKTTGKFTVPSFYLWGWLGPSQFVVPNYCCNSTCTNRSFDCFWVEKDATRFTELLDTDTKDYRPDIMKIKYRTSKNKWREPHFVIVGGYDAANSDYRDYDPGKLYDLPATGFNKIYGGDDKYEFVRLLRFTKLWTTKNSVDESMYRLRVHSPVEVQIIDPQGRRTGYDPAAGTKVVENPMSGYYMEQPISSLDPDDPEGESYKELTIVYPPEGNYILKIFGTGDGPYTIDMEGTTSDGTTNLETSFAGTATPTLLETYRVTYSPTGEASLSHTNQAPVASAGTDQTGEQSYEITLDGRASYDADGDSITYKWSFVSKPNSSGAALFDPHAIKPTFTPDLPGTYILQLVVNDHFTDTDSAPSTVTITAAPLKSRISVTPNFSSFLSAASGIISFDINNIGRISVTAGAIDMSLTDPTGAVVYTGNQSFGSGVGGNMSISFPVTIPSLKFGNYTLTYSQSDETRTGTPVTTTAPNSSVVTFSFDKTIYSVRDTANLTLNLINTGKFNLDGVTLTIAVPDMGYTDTRTILLGLNPNTTSVNYAIPIPANVIAGQHNVNATLTLPSGSSITQSARFALQDSTLVMDIAASTQYIAGSTVTLTVENQGSVDTTYTTQTLTLTDNNGSVIYQGSISDAIMAGEMKTLANVQVPSQFSGSMALLAVTLQDTKTGKLSYLNKSLIINGLQAGLLVRTDKDVYMNTEAIVAISTVANNAFNIENGTLDIKVNRYKKAGSGEFTLFVQEGNEWYDTPVSIAVAADGSVYATYGGVNRIKKFDSNANLVTTWGGWGTGNGQFSDPAGIAVSADGFVYVVDRANNRIQKFDNNGNFIKKWGSRGAGNGQFYYPYGIAVAADGSVYVLDTCNHRIQKFDGNGNFITKWGSYGTGNSQFNYPFGVAVGSDGSVYVADTNNNRILKFDGNGNFITKVPGYFYLVYFIAVAADGSIYVTDIDDRFQKFDSNGNFIKMWALIADGIAIAPDGAVFAAQIGYYTGNLNNGIQKMVPFSEGSEILFEANIPIAQPASITQDYTTNIGILNATGKLYLDATLKNSLGQTIADSEYPFYIVNGNTVLSFSTDKKVYKPGETVTINGEVRNLAVVTASSLNLVIKSQTSAGSQNLFNSTFDVPVNGSHPFTVMTTASSEGAYTLTGTVIQNSATLAEITDQYNVAAPKVSVSITGPDVVGRNPFTLSVQIVNTGTVDANIQYVVNNNVGSVIDSNSLTIPAGQTMSLQYTHQIIQTAVYTFNVSGDVTQTETKTVIYGEAATISIGQGSSIYLEGFVSMPVTVTNTGSIDESVSVTYSLSPSGSNQTLTYYLPKGGSISDTISFILTAGNYQFSATSLLPSASASALFAVVKDPSAAMTTTAGVQGTNGLIPVTVNVANSGHNDLTGSIAVAVMDNFGKAVWRGEGQVAGLKTQTSQNYIVNVASTGLLPGAYSTSITLYNTAGQQLATNQTQVRVLGAIFEVIAVPATPSFTVGKQVALTFGIKNTGTLAGSANLSIKAADLLNQSVSNTLQPGEIKYYNFNFTVPEDAAPQAYLADYVLTSSQSQGTKGQAPFQVAGVDVGVQASLDKDVYRSGETAVLTLSITKQSQFDDGSYLAIIHYGTHHNMQAFTLSSQPVALTFRVPLSEITGARLFYSIHFESGRAVYQNSLVFNPLLPDLIATFDGQGSAHSVDINNTTMLTSSVQNIGKTASEATTLALYDGDSLIDTRPVRALNPGDTDTGTVIWNVLGKAGVHVIKAVADPQDMVIEYSETDNTNATSVTIPDITVFTSTDKDAYNIRQKVYISYIVTNLTPTTTYTELTLTTVAKDPSGNTVYTVSSALGPLAATVSTTATDIWNTAGLPTDGAYTITQTVTSGAQVLTQSSKTVTLLQTSDFTLTTDVNSWNIKQGEKATFVATLIPFNGWDHEVTMSMEGLPAGTTVIFSPDRLLVPGQSQAVVISTDATTNGANTVYLTAQGVDEGEIVSHTVPLTLDVSGFGVSSTAPSATIKQLEKAVFSINLTALNGYTGSVNLSISGLPQGIKASFDSEQTVVPGSVNLTILTSKYAKPGTYTLTVAGNDGLVSHKFDITLVLKPNPNIGVGIIATPGPGPQNDALVRIFNSNQQLTKDFTAFKTEYGATSVSADIDGDGYDEVIIGKGPGPQNTATLRVYKRDGVLIGEFTAFNTTYGLSLAAADLDGDWKDELIVGMGPDPKNASTLKVLKYSGLGLTEVMTQTLYAEATYGVTISAGDVDGDGSPEIITAPGPGPESPAMVTIWRYAPGGLTALRAFRAFQGDYGVNIATGDMDGDGTAEIVTGASSDPKNAALVRIYRSDGSLMKELLPFDTAHSYGVNVSAGDLDSDGRDEIVTGLGPGSQNEPRIRTFKADGTVIGNFLAYPPDMDYGVRVSIGR